MRRARDRKHRCEHEIGATAHSGAAGPTLLQADPAYGTGVAKGLGLNTEKIIATESKVAAAD